MRRMASLIFLCATDSVLTLFIELQPGTLIKDEYFTLFEAVGAIEVHDLQAYGELFHD